MCSHGTASSSGIILGSLVEQYTTYYWCCIFISSDICNSIIFGSLVEQYASAPCLLLLLLSSAKCLAILL